MTIPRRFWFFALAIVIGGSTLSTHAQGGLIDIYGKAASLLNDAAAKVPGPQGLCYLQLAKYNACLGGVLTGGASSCGAPPTNCSTAPMMGIPGIGNLATSAASRVTNSAAQAASRAQDVQQMVNVGFGVIKGFMALRKQRQAQRERAALQQQAPGPGTLQPLGRDPQEEEEARRMQSMAQMMAHQRALLEAAADKLLADGNGLIDSVDQLFADADALVGPSSQGASPSGSSGRAPSGSPSATGSSASPSQRTSSGNPSQEAGSTSPSQSRNSALSAANGDACTRGWADENFTITQFGNDTLWLNSGALAFITNEAGEASALGNYLSLQYETGHKTHMSFGLAGALNNDLAPGDSTRLAISRSGSSSVDIRVRYCKE